MDKGVIEEWKMFLEASLFLMKKKYKDAIETYQTLEGRPLYQFNFASIKTDSQR